MAEKGSQSQVFLLQHREYHSWESTEENDTTHGHVRGGGCMGTPVGLWTTGTWCFLRNKAEVSLCAY